MSAFLPLSTFLRFPLLVLATLLGCVRVNASDVDYLDLTLPHVGDHALHILSPTVLEVRRINSKPPAPAPVDSWDFVDADFVFTPPPTSQFAVTVDGAVARVVQVGFKRRPFYAPNKHRDLRIENDLYLQLASPINAGQAVEVRNPDGQLWAASELYAATADPRRYSPAIHVNQEGYVPTLPKKAMIGYYLGSLGELDVPASSGFTLVNAATGTVVYAGTLTFRADIGYTTAPLPYQKVLQADFSDFTTPGRYLLVVPNLGASVPFFIDDGIAMDFLRTYALGLYHQRCGTTNAMPFTRFEHDACHLAPAEVPTSAADYAFTWTTIAAKNSDYATNPRHTAPQLQDEASQLYPFVRHGPVDVSGGHHDAGDYSKYTINSAALIHRLMFIVDNEPGAGALDNLGLPESGNGVGDLLEEAKREADFLLKMQDSDGGFYFLVYPKNREYEDNVLPDHGDPQVVWPKNTAATAAAVAALAQCASSPRFKAAFPATAAAYQQTALLGWQFLMRAIAQHGKDGAYQKITFYGDIFMHDDELAWAACELFLATGDPQYHAKLLEWLPDPADPNTFRWGWVHLTESWGNAIRDYAFGARSGRVATTALNASYLAQCEAQIAAAGEDALRWSNQNAYASSFPEEMKRFFSAGWYFSLDQASDMATAWLLDRKATYVDALVGNMNYEGGCNPVNVSFITGLGRKRQREIVNQFAQNDARALPPDGMPIGNIQAGFAFLAAYGSELGQLVFPSDGASMSPYEFYDRWADAFNVTQEPITGNQARALASLAILAAPTTAAAQSWPTATAQISAPTSVVRLQAATTLTLSTPGLDLSNATVTWEARDQEPVFGRSYTISPKNNGAQWAEAEIQWPDGRRIFGRATFAANSPVVNWVNGAIPSYGVPVTEGGDAWTWVTSDPAPQLAPAAHQSALASGIHLHAFRDTEAPLSILPGDVLFAWVYLDPANMPTELMLTWGDTNDEHRAYWGANQIPWGTNNTAGRRNLGALPPAGQWVRLEVPASLVGLEGCNVTGMGFILCDGRATFDTAGVMAPVGPEIATHPASQTALIGSTVTLNVNATGVPAPTYQWQRNGSPIVGATGSTYVIPAAQLGDAGDYTVVVTNSVTNVTSNPATLTVTKLNPTLLWSPPAAITYGTALSSTQLNATASVAGTFSYSPPLGAVLGAGTRTLSVTFTPTDTTTYNSATTAVSLLVNRAWQMIAFGSLANHGYGDAPFTLNASADSGLPVSFAIVSGPALVVGNTVTLTGAGTVVIRATQSGNINYFAAPSVDRSFSVTENFASWRLERFTPTELSDPTRSGPNAVFGLDDLPNLIKYALGLEPKTDAVSGLPVSSVAGTDWTYTYTRPSDRADLSYSVEVSSNLASWTTSGVTHTRLGTVGATETWQARYPLASATNAFFRLAVAANAGTAHAPPLGGMTFVFGTGQNVSVSLPLLHAAAGAGTLLGRISGVGSNYLDVGGAGWTVGALSDPVSPYYLRFKTGALAGRIMTVASTPNTATRVFLATDGTDLTQAGISVGASGDVFELVLADTVRSFFGTDVLQGGANDAGADSVQIWSGALWLKFYYNTMRQRWERSTDVPSSPSRDGFVLRPDRGMMVSRIAAGERRIYLSGRVPEVAARYVLLRPGNTFLSTGVPTDVTLGALAFQNVAGWQAGAAPDTAANSADLIQMWAGALWMSFYYDSNLGYWRRTTDVASSPSRSTFVIPAGRPVMITRRTAGDPILPLIKPYLFAP